jgi:hypothetical protein
MKLSLEDLEDKEIGKIGYVNGNGPSLFEYFNFFENIDKSKSVIFMSNEADKYSNINFDYWVVANNDITIANKPHLKPTNEIPSKYLDRINKKIETVFVYADSVDLTTRQFVEDNLLLDYLPYDQRHFDMKTNDLNCHNLTTGTQYGCCVGSINGESRLLNRLTIQEYLQNKCNHNQHYGTASTVALHSLALSIILGCKTIYISGVDLNYSKGYANSTHINTSSFDPHMTEILNDFKIINDSAKNIGVKIYSNSSESPINDIFDYKELNKIF